jgi:hypothetical protein
MLGRDRASECDMADYSACSCYRVDVRGAVALRSSKWVGAHGDEMGYGRVRPSGNHHHQTELRPADSGRPHFAYVEFRDDARRLPQIVTDARRPGPGEIHPITLFCFECIREVPSPVKLGERGLFSRPGAGRRSVFRSPVWPSGFFGANFLLVACTTTERNAPVPPSPRCSTVSSANFGYFDHIGSIHQPALAHWFQS